MQRPYVNNPQVDRYIDECEKEIAYCHEEIHQLQKALVSYADKDRWKYDHEQKKWSFVWQGHAVEPWYHGKMALSAGSQSGPK